MLWGFQIASSKLSIDISDDVGGLRPNACFVQAGQLFFFSLVSIVFFLLDRQFYWIAIMRVYRLLAPPFFICSELTFFIGA